MDLSVIGYFSKTHGVKGHNKNAHQSNHNKAHNGV